ncbi:flagellar basal body-associated protein FliL [Gracilimonas sp. Q87]|uniref:flagellar basal body-associated FliL family protein n=1 Tax=Gracilimonas sp. Q87 TaxID=3384766 RepID=UPI0039845493
MATKKSKTKKKDRASKFLSIGKYFLVLLFFLAQGYLAYAIVDKYYPGVYETMNSKSPKDFGTYEVGELVVNPANTNGKRYLLVEISVELDDKEHISKLDNNKMKLKQEVIETLSKRTIPELVKVEDRDSLRYELIDVINSVIEVRSVRNLYFTKYVMQ